MTPLKGGYIDLKDLLIDWDRGGSVQSLKGIM